MPDHPLSDGTFDPLAALRSGGDDPARATLLRVLWLRQREPDARIETTLVSQVDGTVVFSAVITLPGGGVAHGHAAAGIGDDPGATFEAVENRAIARALDGLGYVVPDPSSGSVQAPSGSPGQRRDEPAPPEATDRAPEHVRALRQMKERERTAPEPDIDDEASPVDSSATSEPQRPAPTVQRPPEARREPASGPESARRGDTTAPAPEVRPVRREPEPRSEAQRPAPTQRQATERPAARREPEPAPTPIRRETGDRPAEPADDADETQLEDVSWTAFWTWARGTYKVSSKGQLEELLGRPMGNATPGQLRLLMIQHFHSESTEN